MGVTLVEQLVAAAQSLSGTIYRAVAGQDQNGYARPLLTDEFGNLNIGANASSGVVDAFGRLRTCQPYTAMTSKMLYADDTDLFYNSTTGSGTITWNSSVAGDILAVTTASGDQAVKQTRYVDYQAGRSLLIKMSTNFVTATGQTNTVKRVGLFDANNGVFFEQSGTAFNVVRRSGGSDVERIAQASWNIDTLNGSGPSKVTLDLTKMQLVVIDMAWQGAGDCYMGFMIGRNLVYCHKFLGGNNKVDPFIETPCLPMRYEITNTGVAAASASLYCVCVACFNEGGNDSLGVLNSANNGTTAIALTSGTLTPILSIRLSSTYAHALIKPTTYTYMQSTAAQNAYIALVLNGTLSGTQTWTNIGTASQQCVTATGISGGKTISSTYIGKVSDTITSSIDTVYLGCNVAGTADILSVAVNSAGAGVQAYGAINFREIL